MPRKTASDLDWTPINLEKSSKAFLTNWKRYLDARNAVKAEVEKALAAEAKADDKVVRVAFKHAFGVDGISYAFADAPKGGSSTNAKARAI